MTKDRPSSSTRRRSLPKLARARSALTTILSAINSPVQFLKLYSSPRCPVNKTFLEQDLSAHDDSGSGIPSFNSGHSVSDTQQLIRRRFHLNVPERTISSWLAEHRPLSTYARLRATTRNLDPRDLIARTPWSVSRSTDSRHLSIRCALKSVSDLPNGARLRAGSEVRIHGVVQINSVLPPHAVVPIGGIAVGDPAQVLAPNEHECICPVQKELHFPRTVFGLERVPEGQSIMLELTRRYTRALLRHKQDQRL